MSHNNDHTNQQNSFQHDKNCNIDGLTFDDVLLLPGYTDFFREIVTTEVQLSTNIKLKIPVFSSPMDTVTESAMAISIAKMGGIGIIHRSMSIADQVKELKLVKNTVIATDIQTQATNGKGILLCGTAVGASPDFEERVRALAEAGTDLFVLDTAQGFAQYIIDYITKIKSITNISIMGGNVVTYDGAMALIKAGVDILRVGMGPGSICTTRIVTGVGVPQLTAISEVKASCARFW